MYLGSIVEHAPIADLIGNPKHRYTEALMRTIPSNNEPGTRLPAIGGTVPQPAQRPPGCAFHPRCPLAEARCRETTPALTTLGGGRRVACHVVAVPAAATREAA